MNAKLSLICLLLIVQFIFAKSFAQTAHSNLTIVYDISIKKIKHSTGIEETYNGGTKAVFINGQKARIRLVSLMRIESVFFDYDTSTLKRATVIKESGAKKYLFKLDAEGWKDYNSKYLEATCDSLSDSTTIAGYNCKKAIVNLPSGEKIDVYYTDRLKAENSFIEPAFSCIPGTVLQYQHSTNRGVITFTASQVSTDAIAKDIFIIPSKGVEVRQHLSQKSKEQL